MHRGLAHLVVACLILAALGAITAACYAPGLKGGFLFDDSANLPALGATGPIDNAQALARYLTSGRADPTGRPVAVASFLLDARDWPADPRPFKRTNLILHLLNGALLFAVLAWMGALNQWSSRKAAIGASVGTMAWLLNPFFVSTVLYVVQREAMLPATFILAGILSSFAARERLRAGHIWKGYAWLIAGVGSCTLLAFLSKANGILLPLLVLVVHATLPRDERIAAHRARIAFLVVLGPVAMAVLAWIAWTAVSTLGDPPIPHRGWTITQRLLTEPTILADYVSRIFLLRPVDGSLLHDDYRVATSLFAPWYTGIFACLWIAVAVIAWRSRHRYPSASLAVLFFLAAHLIESGPIGLELYFEHRNYVPAMLLFWPLGAALGQARSRTLVTITATALMGILGLLTHAQAVLWGRPVQQAESWAMAHPESARALTYVAGIEAASGRREQAIRRLDYSARLFPDEPQVQLNLTMLSCETGMLPRATLIAAETSLRTAPREPGSLLLRWFSDALPVAHAGTCKGLDRDALNGLLDAALQNPRIAAMPGRRQDILHMRGAMALAWGEPTAALDAFNGALAEEPEPQVALEQAAALGRAGFPAFGLRHLDTWNSLQRPTPLTWRDGMPWLHDLVLGHQGYWTKEFTRLEATLRADAVRRPA